MAFPKVLLMRLSTKSIFLVAFLVIGCQEQASLPLDPAGLSTTTAESARVVLFDPCADLSDSGKVLKEFVDAINAERAKHKLGLLKQNTALMQIADYYACRLVDGRFLKHIDPFNGSTVDSRAADFGYAFLRMGENLAAGQRSVEHAMADWMNSPSHRANILDPSFTEIGIAVKHGPGTGTVWVQEFGRPITESPLPFVAGQSEPTPIHSDSN